MGVHSTDSPHFQTPDHTHNIMVTECIAVNAPKQTLTADMLLGAYRAMRETQELQSTPISIDTFDAEVAAQAVAAGAHMVNDVSGGTMDPNMHAQVRRSLGRACCMLYPTHALPGRHKQHIGYTQIAYRIPRCHGGFPPSQTRAWARLNDRS